MKNNRSNAAKIMMPDEYRELERMKASLPKWAQVDEGGVYQYLIISMRKGDEVVYAALDDDYLKVDLSPVGALKGALKYDSDSANKLRRFDAERDDITGLYLLKGQTKTSSGEIVNYGMLAVPLSEMLGIDEKIDMEKAHYLLVQRSRSGISREVTDHDGRVKKLNYGIALISGDAPFTERFNAPQRIVNEGACPAIVKSRDDKIIASVVDLEAALSGFTDTFLRKYPELSRYYPFSPDFRFAEKSGF